MNKIIKTVLSLFLLIGIFGVNTKTIFSEEPATIEFIYGYGRKIGTEHAESAINNLVDTGYSIKGEIIKDSITSDTGSSANRFSQSIAAKTSLTGTEYYYDNKHIATNKNTSIKFKINGKDTQLFAVAYNDNAYYCRLKPSFTQNPKNTKIIEHYVGEYTVSVNDDNVKDVTANNYYVVKNPDLANYEFYIPSDKYSFTQNNEEEAISLFLTLNDNFDFYGLEFNIGENTYYYDGEENGTAYLNGSTGKFENSYDSNDILKYEDGCILFYKINANINIKYSQDEGSHTVTFVGLENYNLTNPNSLTVKHNRTIDDFNPLGSDYIEYQGLNYKFDGWYENKELSNLFDFSTPITKDLTLYCKLAEREDHIIRFNNINTISSTTNWDALDASTKTIILNDDFHASSTGEQIQFSVAEIADDNVSSIDIKIGNNTYTLVNDGLNSLLYSKELYLDLNGQITSDSSNTSNLTLKYAHSTSSARNIFFWRFYNVTSNIEITVHLKPHTLTYYVDDNAYTTQTVNYGMSLNDLELSLPNNPTKDKEIFEGWFYDEDFTKEFNENTKINENRINIYAKFEKLTAKMYQQVVLNNDGSLGINCKFTFKKDFILSNNDYVYAKVDGEYHKVNKVIEDDVQSYTYKIDNIKPSEMTKTYNIQLFDSNTENAKNITNSHNISLSSCFSAFIDEYSNKDVGLVNFVKTMLNYGTNCQLYYDVNINNLANEFLSSKDKTIGNQYTVSSDNEYKTTGSLNGISAYGYNLVLNSNTDMKVYFMIDKDKNINDYVFREGIKKLEPSLYKGRVYCVTLLNVSAPDLDKMHSIDVTNANYSGQKLTISCNPLSYVYSQVNAQNSDTKLMNMLNSLSIINQFSKVAKKSANGEYVLSYYSYDESSNGVINKNLFYQNTTNEWLADPSFIYVEKGRDAGYYYVYGTTASKNETCIGAWRSKNLTNWQFVGPVFIPDRTNGWQYYKGLWAPQVIKDPDDGKYYLFYSCPWGYNEETPFRYDSCAVSDNPYGPFKELDNANKSKDEPLLVFENHYNELPENIQNEHKSHYGYLNKKGYIKAIGPSPFVDPKTGDKYIFFCQDLSSSGTAASQSGGYCIKMKNKNWSTPDYSSVKRVTLYNHITTDKTSASANELNDTNEGPMCFYNSKTNKYYLLFLTSKYMLKDYQTRIAVSDNPDGPYTKLQLNEGAQVMYTENQFKRQATGIHGIIETDDKQIFAAWMTFMNGSYYRSTGDGGKGDESRRKFAIDELVYVKNSYGTTTLQSNGPSVTPQPLPKSMSGYYNLAKDASITINGEMTQEESDRLKYLNDGVIPYHANSLSTDGTKSLEFATSRKSIEITLSFDDYKTLRSVMVYNSKTKSKQFDQIDSITFNFRKNGEEASTTIGPVLFNTSYNDISPTNESVQPKSWEPVYEYTDSKTIAIGAAAICEFDELDVKSVVITISKPEGNEFINIPEIYLIGKEYDGSSNLSKALTNKAYTFSNSNVNNGELNSEDCKSEIEVDGIKESYYGSNPVCTVNGDNSNKVDMYSFKGNDGLYMFFDVNEQTLKKNTSTNVNTRISNSSHLELNITSSLNAVNSDEHTFRFIINYNNEGRRQVGARHSQLANSASEKVVKDITFYSSVYAKQKESGGYTVEIFIPYSEFGTSDKNGIDKLKYDLAFAYNNSGTLTTITSNGFTSPQKDQPNNWASRFAPVFQNAGLQGDGDGNYHMPYINVPD